MRKHAISWNEIGMCVCMFKIKSKCKRKNNVEKSSSAQQAHNWIHKGNSYVSNLQTKGNKMQNGGCSLNAAMCNYYVDTQTILLEQQKKCLEIFFPAFFHQIDVHTWSWSVNKIF